MYSRVYVKNSLANTETGFTFKLKNILETVNLTGVGPFSVDEKIYPVADTRLILDDQDFPATSVTRENPLPDPINREMQVHIAASPLAPGEHRLSIQLQTCEAGRISFTIGVSLE
jgi:hypothetical protein